MKVLLIDPPKRIWDMMGDCCPPPLGLAYLAAALEEKGIPVAVIDSNGMGITWETLPGEIRKASPDIVGTGGMTSMMGGTLKTVELVKEIDPTITTVVGGLHATFVYEAVLRETPAIDVIVRGEGEETLVDLVHSLEAGSPLNLVKGIAYREDGNIVATAPRPPLDVKNLPLPAYHLLPMESYHFEFLGEFTTMLTSRGCPHSCTFCSECDFWGRPWRPRTPESVGEELELVNRTYKRESVWFGDDCFNVDYDHMKGICEQILERGLDIQWFYQGRVDFLIKHKELLPLMRKAGNIMTQVGIEASTDEELAVVNKKITTEQIREAVNLLKAHDIVCQGLMIVGTFDETPKSILHKIRFMKSMRVDFPIFTMFTPFPGSKVYEQAKREGLIEDTDFNHFDMAYPIMPTRTLSRGELFKWYVECFREYYFDPLQILMGVLSRRKLTRIIWRHMFSFGLKQMYKFYFGKSLSWP